jgi:hypothetical protein
MLNLTPYPTIKFAKEVNINIPTGYPNNPVGNVFFDYDAEISNSKLTGICFVPLTMNNNFNGLSLSIEQAKSVYITLVNRNNERIIDSLPLNALYTLNSAGNIILRRFSTHISLENSFVTFTGDQDISGNVIVFTFYYNPNI